MKSKTKIKSTAERWHYTAPYILNPQHPITINVVGAGGNGSQVLTQLARIDHALKNLGHVGLHVTCYDPDIVTEANLGRQLFSAADLDLPKATVLITRINQFLGTSWKAVVAKYHKKVAVDSLANITISCVDSIEARQAVRDRFATAEHWRSRPYSTPYYWFDLGNTQTTGQFIIGTCQDAEQPKESSTLKPVPTLPNVFQKFPGFEKQKTKDSGPSCSLAEALGKQDLFINSFLVQTAMATLWKMFREGRIRHHGAFVNLQTLDIAPIQI